MGREVLGRQVRRRWRMRSKSHSEGQKYQESALHGDMVDISRSAFSRSSVRFTCAQI